MTLLAWHLNWIFLVRFCIIVTTFLNSIRYSWTKLLLSTIYYYKANVVNGCFRSHVWLYQIKKGFEYPILEKFLIDKSLISICVCEQEKSLPRSTCFAAAFFIRITNIWYFIFLHRTTEYDKSQVLFKEKNIWETRKRKIY